MRPLPPPASRAAMVAGLLAATVCVGALIAPWVALGSRRFSSLDLLSSAAALEILEGRQKSAVMAAWMIVPTVVAASYVLAAIGRPRLVGAVLLSLAPVYLAARLAVARRLPLRIEWGLQLGLGAAVMATLAGVVLLLPRSDLAGV